MVSTFTVRPAAFRYAVVRFDFAVCAAPFVRSVVPSTVPGGNPVIEVPAQSPRLLLRTLGPVLVTLEPASTE